MRKVIFDVDGDAEFITLQFEDSEDIECEILGVFDCDGQEYIALLPDDGTDDVYIAGSIKLLYSGLKKTAEADFPYYIY